MARRPPCHGHLRDRRHSRGWREPLDDLLGRIEPRLEVDDTVVFLGDYIDRGDDSRGVVDAILGFRERSPAHVVCLIGNHEEWLLQTMRDPASHSWLLGMDGYAPMARSAAGE